ncbi:dihydrofolate reductase [Desulforhopalus singaporensis]|uniref:Dihydrofolate reductase n=1 Tax=Desulforhopalus singaporensis TaxID=91360 RepID=A0A1H0L2X0_9BACT|nr:dihydrofolate reductase [Desulforhopalus singaporensis]SDO62559.1 dihydrofolate reductase [Desulforhopalus singaporensis]
MQIILIAAMAKNRTIGKNGKMPWHIPEELKFFKKTTMGFPMIMGRKTFDSLPAPLPGRRHIVLSRTRRQHGENVDNAESLGEAVRLCGNVEKIFIIGGAEIFAQGFEVATHIILTILKRDVDGDVFFPEFTDSQFREISREEHPDASEPFTTITYARVS